MKVILQKINIFCTINKRTTISYTDNSPILNLKPDVDKGNETPADPLVGS